MSQIFRNPIPIIYVYDLLEKVCDNSLSDIHYIFSMSSYKKLCYHGYDTEFLQKIIPYYHYSKQYYVQRPQNYKTFSTLIRQICKFNDIVIFSKMNYYNSSYIMEYFIEKQCPPSSSVLSVEPQEKQENESPSTTKMEE